MGLLDRMRSNNEAKVNAAHAAARTARVQAAERRLAETHVALDAARLGAFTSSVPGVVLKRDERVYVHVDGAHFVEPKREPGQWVGASSGVSFRVAKGVSYRVGQSRGTYQQGAERPTATDQGLFVVTNLRCIFIGSKKTTEWSYAKLLGFSLEGEGTAFFSVSNRQRTTGVFYGPAHEAQVDATIAAAIAQHQGAQALDELISELISDVTHAAASLEALQRGQLPPPVVG